MRSTRTLTAILSSLILASCSDAVTAPRPVDHQPSITLANDVLELRESDEIVVSLDHTLFIECAGEPVRFVGDVVYTIHQGTTPTGQDILRVTVSASSSPFLAIGQESGTTWTLKHGMGLQTVIRDDGVTQVVRVIRQELYVADDGSKLLLHHTLNMRLRDGELVGIDNEAWSCH